MTHPIMYALPSPAELLPEDLLEGYRRQLIDEIRGQLGISTGDRLDLLEALAVVESALHYHTRELVHRP